MGNDRWGMGNDTMCNDRQCAMTDTGQWQTMSSCGECTMADNSKWWWIMTDNGQWQTVDNNGQR